MNQQNKETVKQYWLYVLKLEHGKYYIGITSKTPEIRMQQHLNGFIGAKWTGKHKPLKILDKKNLGELSVNEAKKYENKVVRAYMKKYGFSNVRGGDLSYSEKLVKRFGWYIAEKEWETFTAFVLLVLLFFALALAIYL